MKKFRGWCHIQLPGKLCSDCLSSNLKVFAYLDVCVYPSCRVLQAHVTQSMAVPRVERSEVIEILHPSKANRCFMFDMCCMN